MHTHSHTPPCGHLGSRPVQAHLWLPETAGSRCLWTWAAQLYKSKISLVSPLCISSAPFFPQHHLWGLWRPLGSRLSLRAGMGNKVARSREEKDGKEDKERKEIKAGWGAIDLKTSSQQIFQRPYLGTRRFHLGQPEWNRELSSFPTSPSALLDLRELRATFLTLVPASLL